MSRARVGLLSFAVLLVVAPLRAQTTFPFGSVIQSFPTGARTPFTVADVIENPYLYVETAFTSPDDPTAFSVGPFGMFSAALGDANGFPNRLSIAYTATPIINPDFPPIAPLTARLLGACIVGGSTVPAIPTLQAFRGGQLVGTAQFDGQGHPLSSVPPATEFEICLGSSVFVQPTPVWFDRLELSSTAPDFYVGIVAVAGVVLQTPEPATLALVGGGLLLFGALAVGTRICPPSRSPWPSDGFCGRGASGPGSAT